MNYYKNQYIIDKPKLVNQANCKRNDSKGTVEDKLMELEYILLRKNLMNQSEKSKII